MLLANVNVTEPSEGKTGWQRESKLYCHPPSRESGLELSTTHTRVSGKPGKQSDTHRNTHMHITHAHLSMHTYTYMYTYANVHTCAHIFADTELAHAEYTCSHTQNLGARSGAQCGVDQHGGHVLLWSQLTKAWCSDVCSLVLGLQGGSSPPACVGPGRAALRSCDTAGPKGLVAVPPGLLPPS